MSSPLPHPSAFPPNGADLGAPAGKTGRILQILQARFASGHYRFGEKLSVVDLAQEFGVSRQPIMTSMRDLAGDGFVIITPQVGCEAAAPDKNEIQDFFSVFAKMEGRMAGMAAERHDDADMVQLRAAQASFEQSPTGGGHWNLDSVSHFHSVIRHMARTPALANRIGKFWHMANYILRNGQRDYPESVRTVGNRERAGIVAAIAERDAQGAERAMELHVLGKPHRVGLL
ncbi:MAG: hypothetical protein ABS43_15985 [Bordetella sp. SCN 67-23]|nr:GntR family transcriptional regulator [Burkholderiales bacterium]ODS72739.1 MAG: hypothetical protein ABS43_15985 [Bordetella sp. SCN 67-23]ODU97344.1 MAG: hypothetical protein ABT00_00895 [Bordetella sp. SCN 68-11]OJW92893.1 MAG: hypothetical protein BGO71_24425 [Burkholderiales bacterium 67-32]